MTTTVRAAGPAPRAAPPADGLPFNEGDRLTQAEFHRLYEQTSEHFTAELIGGIVHMPSPIKSRHGRSHSSVAGLLAVYEHSTPGVEFCQECTIILGGATEVQPDAWLTRLPEVGGRMTVDAASYFRGPPDLVVEVSDTTAYIDLGPKRDDYRRAGVREYLVLVLRENRLRSLDLEHDRESPADADGVWRSRAFPGLWLDVAALLARDHARLHSALRAGLASPEHAAFVGELTELRARPAT